MRHRASRDAHHIDASRCDPVEDHVVWETNAPDTPIAIFPRERPTIPAGEAIAKCEAPRGKPIHYVRPDGSAKPERLVHGALRSAATLRQVKA